MSNERRFCARLARGLHAVAQCPRGVAAIEFGITMAAILVIVLGTYDIGNYVLQQMKLADAAHVGGQYAISYPIDTAGATSAVDAVLPPAWLDDTTVTGPSMTCTCGSSGTGDAASCSATCPTGQLQRFVTVTLTRNYAPLLVIGLTQTTASYVVRIQ